MPEKFDFSKIEDQNEFETLPQEEKDKIVGESQAEAAKISEQLQGTSRESGYVTDSEIVEKIIQKNNFGPEEFKLPEIKTEHDKKDVEAIKNKTIDIKEFSGLVHQTHLPNLIHVFLEGFSYKSAEEAKWIEDGERRDRRQIKGIHKPSYFNVNASIYSEKGSLIFEPRWTGSGNVAILFDVEKLRNTNSYGDCSRFIDQKSNGQYVNFQNVEDGILLDKAITGVVSLSHSEGLERRQWHGFRKDIKLAPKQIRKHSTNRFSRLFEHRERQKPKIDFVPIYDSFGNMIWPEKIDYEDVKKFVADRDKKKEENEKAT